MRLEGSIKGGGRRRTMGAEVAALSAALFAAAAAAAEPFDYVRIGDADGFGFTDVAEFVRAWTGPEAIPADSDGDGRLGEREFLPDLNGDGGVAVFSHDNFDNRSADEIADRGHSCVGCLSIGEGTQGSIWTDLSLSASAPPANWPDADGPQTPNNAVFVFEFTAARDGILEHSQVFFNLVFGDYDIDPSLIGMELRDGTVRTLALANQGPHDGLIQGRSTVLEFDEVFAEDEDGNWAGLLTVVFFAPNDPYTAFDYVELSRFELVSAAIAP